LTEPLVWIEVRVLVPNGWQELVAQTLMFGPCTSAAFGRPNLAVDEPPPGFDYVRIFISKAEDTPALRNELATKLADLARLTEEPDLAALQLRFNELPAEDYATSWKMSWKAFRVGPICLLPPWDDREVEPHEKRLTIQPGGSFGSGRHATTRTCLRVLTQRIKGGERVLDAGTGSGILSVASALLGAESALGFDIDPYSSEAAGDLSRDNHVQEQCTFRVGGFETLQDDETEFDVVLGNIYSDIIQLHAKDLARRLAPDGWFAFSGCPHQHLQPTLDAIDRAGLVVDDPRRRGRWHTFVGRHK
jgi:ribosomal protein L11 methyltransferase